jgi:Flp pilus assembly protein TadD
MLREAQEMEAAFETVSAAAEQAPNDPQAAFGLAQISFETWRPAAELFAKARALVPGNPDILRNHAMALAAEGHSDAAKSRLAGRSSDIGRAKNYRGRHHGF